MAEYNPIRLNTDAEGNPDGFAEFGSGEYIGLEDGGTGGAYSSLADLRIGLGLQIGSDVQAYDADLTTISNLIHSDGTFIVSDGTQWVAESGNTARTSLGLGTTDDVVFNTLETTGSVTIGGNLDVQGEVINTTAEVIYVDDAYVKLNTGNGEVNAGIIVETTDTDDARLFYDVTLNRWVLGENQTYDEVVTQSSTDTLTNKTLDGGSNTFTNLPNSAFSNSAITITDQTNSTDIALGDTITFVGGAGVDIVEGSGTLTFTTDLTEILEDFTDTVGDMVSGNSETLIAVTFDDSNNKLNFQVQNDLSQYDNTTSAFIDLTDLSATTSTGVTYNNLTGVIALASIPNTSLTNSDITFTDGTTPTVASLGDTITLTGGSGVDIVNTAGNFEFTVDLSEITEEFTDKVGGMFGGTQTLVSITYDDPNDRFNVVVEDDLSLYDNTTSAFITASSTDTLTNKTFDANGTGNSISNIEVADFATGVLDTDLATVSASDDTLASAKAIKDYVDSLDRDDDLDITIGATTYTLDLDTEDLLFASSGTQLTVAHAEDVSGNITVTYTLDDDLSTYDNSTSAFITLTSLSAPNSDGVDYDNTTGQITLANIPNASLTNSSVTINANALSLGGTLTLDTDDIQESVSPTNLYFTDERAQDAIDAAFSAGTQTRITYAYNDIANSYSLTVDDDLSNYDNTTTAFIDLTDLSGGTGVTYNNATGQISIGQAVETTSDVQFNNVQVDGTLTSDDITSTTISISGDAIITGDLTVQGTTTTVDSTTVAVGDSMFKFAKDNTTNGLDIGFYGKIVQSSTTKYVGLHWDAGGVNKFKLFDGLTVEPTTTVDTADASYNIATLVADIEGNVTGNADTATALQTARNIGGVSFDGSADIDLPGVNISGNQDTSGNAASATILQTARDFSITGDVTASAISFDGSGNVALASTISAGAVEFTMMDGAAVITSAEGVVANNTDDTSFPTTKAVYDYVNAIDVDDDLSIAGDTGTGTVDLDLQTLTIAGGTGLDSSVSGQTITIDIDSTVATLTGTQTLTNKTLGATTIAGHLIPDTDVSYDLGSSSLKFRDLYLSGSSIYLDTNQINLNTGNFEFTDGANVITMPIASTDTLVARDTTDTLANKTVIDTDNTMVKTIEVDVTNSKFRFNGEEDSQLNLEVNTTYRFDTSHTSLATDEFALSETEDGEYTVTNTTSSTTTFSGLDVSDGYGFFPIIGHSFSTGDAVEYNSNSNFEISGLTNGTTYYVIDGSPDPLEVDYIGLAASLSDAQAGTAITLNAGSGTHNLISYTYTYGTEYTTSVNKVGTQGQAGSYVDVRVHTITPTLFPYSKNNSGRGGQGRARRTRSGRFVTINETDTLTNKVINFENNTGIIEFAVTVVSSGGNFYALDGELTASVSLTPGFTYRFDLSDSSQSSHPFALSDTKDGSHGGGNNVGTLVGTPGTSGAYYEITVDASTPDLLYYYCTVHSGMGGDSVITVAGTDLSNITSDDILQGSTNKYYADSFVESYLSGGTGITFSSGNISVDSSIITNQSQESSPANVDELLVYDTSAGSLKRSTISQILAQAGTGSMSSFSITDGTNTSPITDADTLTFNGTTDQINVTVGTDSLTIGLPQEITTDINGAIHVKAKNETGGTLTKGTPVYISGQSGSGNEFTIDVADADNSATMPAVGILYADVSNNQSATIVTHGKFIGLDTSSYSVGDILYVSTTGTLTNSVPTGETSGIQKIAKVIRSHASAGQIYVTGASRTNATPNLDDGNIFIGNASNQASTASLNTKIADYLGSGGDITISGNLIVQGTTTTIDSTSINVQNAFVFEGATDDAFETTLTVVDPTADRTVSLPDEDGTLALNKSTFITGQSALVGSIDTTNDLVIVYDDSSTSLVKVDVATLLASAGAGSFNDFTLTADSGTSEVVADGNTVTIAGGTGIDTVVGATDTVTINIDNSVITTSSSLGDLNDVDFSAAPQGGQVLEYDNASSSWKPAYVSGGGGGATPTSIRITNFLGIESYITVANNEIPFQETADGTNFTSDPLPVNGALPFEETADGTTFSSDDIAIVAEEEYFQVIADEDGDTVVSTTETANEISFFTNGQKRAVVDDLGFNIGEGGMGYRNADVYDDDNTVPTGQNMMMVGPVSFYGTITVNGRLVIA